MHTKLFWFTFLSHYEYKPMKQYTNDLKLAVSVNEYLMSYQNMDGFKMP